MEQTKEVVDDIFLQKNSLFCELHPGKLTEFYCFFHQSLSCSKCVTMHVDCQVKGQFSALEDIYERFTIMNKNTLSEIDNVLNDTSIEKTQLEDKLLVLQGLKASDLAAIENYFDEMRKKAEQLRVKALENYEVKYDMIMCKISERITEHSAALESSGKIKSCIQTMNSDLEKLTDPLLRQYKTVTLTKDLNNMRSQIQERAKPLFLNDELEGLLNKEEVISELGTLTLLYSNMDTKMIVFAKEQLPEMINGNVFLKSSNTKSNDITTRFPEIYNTEETIKEIEKDEIFGGLKEGDFFPDSEELGRKKVLHQLRYSSNEVYTYNLETKVFETFYLYDSKDYDDPFLIFNNCCSIIIKNHLGFLFGGEDSNDKDRSSKRAFCFNLEKKTKDNKIVVYELDEMNFARQEFTLTAINNFVYLISGYDSNQLKEKRVIPKCEKFDLKTKKFYEVRDINYPRQWACSLNMNNTHIYTFNGMNPKYLNTFVDKIEKYIINVNDWVVLKYSLLDNVDYTPAMKSTCFRINENEIVIFGGVRDHEILTDYFIFDVRKLVMVKKSEKPILKKTDEFQNQNDVIVLGGHYFFYSGTYVNRVYDVKTVGNSNYLALDIVKQEEGNL